MDKMDQKKCYLTPDCRVIRINEQLMQSTSFNNSGGHQKAEDDGTLNAKKTFGFENEYDNASWYND